MLPKKIVITTVCAIATITPQTTLALTFSGNSRGFWGMPSNSTASTAISSRDGGTMNYLEWGRVDMCPACTSFNNYVQYDGTGFSTTVGSLFNLGTMSYRNGSVWDTFSGDFPLVVTLSLLGIGDYSLAFGFNILTTPNVTGDPVADGDRLRFSNLGFAPQDFSVGDSIYRLSLVGFSSNNGINIVSEFNSPEGTTATASLYGRIDQVSSPKPPTPIIPALPSPGPVIPTPEPTTPVPTPGIFLGALLALGCFLRRSVFN